jgi:hypothetical protein
MAKAAAVDPSSVALKLVLKLPGLAPKAIAAVIKWYEMSPSGE